MKTTHKVRIGVSPLDGGIALGTALHEVFRETDGERMDEEVRSAFLDLACTCDSDAYRDLYARLKGYRRCFTSHIFADPEATYRDFVRDLVAEVRCGFLPDPEAVVARARASAMRKTSDRVRTLTMAARVLSTLPKRYREVLIRAQLDLKASERLAPESDAVRDWPPTRRLSPAPRKPIQPRTSPGGYGHPAAVA